MEIILALVGGLITGFVFTLVNIPIPAPPVWSGVMSIIGVISGSQLCNYLFK